MIEKFGVRVTNPQLEVHIEGQSFAEMILYQYLHQENLKRVVSVLSLENPDGANERLYAAQVVLQAMVNTSGDALQDYLHLAKAQGLHFEMAVSHEASH